MENQLATLKSGIDAIKKKKPKKDKVHRRDKYGASSVGTSKNGKTTIQKLGKKKKMKTLPDEEVLSFEQKKDLSETIQNLDGAKLERVIQIIHEGVPEIRDVSSQCFYFLFCIVSTRPCVRALPRALRRLSSTSTLSLHLCSPNYTTMSYAPCVLRSVDRIIPVAGQVGSSGRAWTRTSRQRKSGVSRRSLTAFPMAVQCLHILVMMKVRVLTRATTLGARAAILIDSFCCCILLCSISWPVFFSWLDHSSRLTSTFSLRRRCQLCSLLFNKFGRFFFLNKQDSNPLVVHSLFVAN